MMLKKKDIKLIEDVFKKLEQEFGMESFEDEFDEYTENIYFPFPRDEEIEIKIDDLLECFQEFDSFVIHDYNKVTTDTITQRVVTASELSPIYYLSFFETITPEGIRLRILTDPILIGIAATKKDEYSKYYPPCSSHIAVEVKYPTKESRLSNEVENNLIKSYFFELAHSYKMSFTFSTYLHYEEFDKEAFEESIKNLPNVFEEYNPGMDLFIKANQSLSSDLKFLTLYKIFEYFAPVYSKIDAFEAMRKKLDSSNANNLSAEFISSIFDLTKSYDKSLRDKELIKSLIDNTFDLVDIYNTLPQSIRENMKIEKLEYKTKKETKTRIINSLGKVLYDTRNEIVHAKSNFNPTGFECNGDDLNELNEFMHLACYSTIKWYNRLPKHLKIT